MLVQLTAKFIALSLQPVSVVPVFKVSWHYPRFEFPHKTYCATKVISQMYVSVCNRIEERLRDVGHVAERFCHSGMAT